MALPMTFFDMSYSPLRGEGQGCFSILSTIDELPRDAPVTFKSAFDVALSDWFHFPLLEGIRARSHVYGTHDGGWVIGDRGQAWHLKGDNKREYQLPDSGLDGRGLGPPNQIRLIGGQLFVCGYAGQVYTFNGSQWVHMDDGLAEPTGTPESIDLTSIDGTAPDDLYVVGSGGLVAHWDGRCWTRIPVPTNVYLSHVRCFRKDWIVAVGDRGVVLESDGRRFWVSRIDAAEDRTLSNVELYQDRLYVAAVEDLFVRGKDWEVVRHGLDKSKTTFLKLTVAADRLWALGFKRLVSFDGSTWRAHINRNNE